VIGIDWGSTNFRAFRFDAKGEVVERRLAARGAAFAITRGYAFEAVLFEAVRDWLKDDREILLAGKVGSRNGWVEAGYVSCPADSASIAAHLAEVQCSLGRCRIVPGIRCDAAGGPGEVMRGQETLLLGSGLRDGLVLLPGTHSKWATLKHGRITSFRTAITGELHSVLLEHTMLGKLADVGGTPDPEPFSRGVLRSLQDPAVIMTMFSARSDVLLGSLAPSDVRDYLSGLLIGAEIAAMKPDNVPLTVIGGIAQAERYRAALELAGVKRISVVDGDDAAARGLWAIGRAIQ